MLKIEEKLEKDKQYFLIYACGECGCEVLVPGGMPIPELHCLCKKPMEFASEIWLKKDEINN